MEAMKVAAICTAWKKAVVARTTHPPGVGGGPPEEQIVANHKKITLLRGVVTEQHLDTFSLILFNVVRALSHVLDYISNASSFSL